jgi:hypothetical protein
MAFKRPKATSPSPRRVGLGLKGVPESHDPVPAQPNSAVCVPPDLPEGRGVVGDDDELRLSHAQTLERLLVAEDVLARLHHEGQPRVDRLYGLLRLLCGHHLDEFV